MAKTGQEQLDIVLEEMCHRVGTTLDDVNVQSPGWFRTYTWDNEEQDSFKEWMVEYLYNNREARKVFFGDGYRKPKKTLREQANWFLFDYGWMLE